MQLYIYSHQRPCTLASINLIVSNSIQVRHTVNSDNMDNYRTSVKRLACERTSVKSFLFLRQCLAQAFLRSLSAVNLLRRGCKKSSRFEFKSTDLSDPTDRFKFFYIRGERSPHLSGTSEIQRLFAYWVAIAFPDRYTRTIAPRCLKKLCMHSGPPYL